MPGGRASPTSAGSGGALEERRGRVRPRRPRPAMIGRSIFAGLFDGELAVFAPLERST